MTTTPGYETTIGVLDPTTPAEPMGKRYPELARNRMIGRYQIIKLLGKGGIGAVYAPAENVEAIDMFLAKNR